MHSQRPEILRAYEPGFGIKLALSASMIDQNSSDP